MVTGRTYAKLVPVLLISMGSLTGCEPELGNLYCRTPTDPIVLRPGETTRFAPECGWVGSAPVSATGQKECKWTDFAPVLVLEDMRPLWLSATSTGANSHALVATETARNMGEARVAYWIQYDDPACTTDCRKDASKGQCAPLKSGKMTLATVETTDDKGNRSTSTVDVGTHDELPLISVKVMAPLGEDWKDIKLIKAPLPYSATLNTNNVVECTDHSVGCAFSAPTDATLEFIVPSAPANCTWTCGNEELPCSAASFTVTEDVTCTMKAPTQQLTYGTTGDGSGQVDVYIDGTQFIGCDGQCDLPKDKQIELRATQSAGSDFRGWQGHCAGLGPNATIVLDGDKTCTAEFAQNAAMDTLVVELLNSDGMNIELFAEDNTPLTQQGSEYSASVPHMTAVPLAIRTVGDVTIDFSVAWECGNTLSTTGHNVSIPVNGPTNCTATIQREDPCEGTPTPIIPAVAVSQPNVGPITANPMGSSTYRIDRRNSVVVLSSEASTGGDGQLSTRWILPSMGGQSFDASGPIYEWTAPRFLNDVQTVTMEVSDACGQTESLVFDIIGS